MMKRSKKVVSTVAVSAVLAAQAVMSAAAAGGSITADVSTKSPVLRVAVPTKMAVAVNEFEMAGDTGSQIFSDEFTMQNKSEIPVNVKVTSEATIGSNVTLAATKKEAEDSTDTAKPAMWLAAVAAVNNNSGDLEYLKTGTDKSIAGLAGTEENITAFATKDSKNTASQNFYLKAATTSTYKGITGAEVTAEKSATTATIGGADFYEITALSPATDDAAGVNTLAESQDVYVAKGGAPVGGTPATLVRVEKGETITASDWTAGTSKVYKLAAAPTAVADLDATKLYLYIDDATPVTGDSAAFRYIGALSGAKSGWSSTTDLTGVTIKYDIVAISTTAYTEVAKADGSGLTYGYKKEDSKMTLVGDTLTIKIKVADFKAGSLSIGATTGALDAKAGTWGGADDAVTFKFNSTWANAIKGQTCKVTVTLQNDDTIEETFNVPN